MSPKNIIIIIQLSDPNLMDFSIFFCSWLIAHVLRFLYIIELDIIDLFLEYSTLLFYDSEFGIGIAG